LEALYKYVDYFVFLLNYKGFTVPGLQEEGSAKAFIAYIHIGCKCVASLLKEKA